jgi:proline iminopeptidase
MALGIDRWIVFGGSWGATLALIYAQTHPERALHLILRGVFLMTQAELAGSTAAARGSSGRTCGAVHSTRFPEDERDDLIAAYHRRLFSGDVMMETRHARAWASWENTLASIENDGPGGDSPADYARAFARLENHYFMNGGFLEEDGQILPNMDLLEEVPGTIVQGRYDMICPPVSACACTRPGRDRGL